MWKRYFGKLVNNRTRTRPGTPRRHPNPTCRLELQRLEDRSVPSCNPGISGGVLQTNCSFGPDVVILDHAGSTTTIRATGIAPRSFADSSFGSILLQTGSTNGQTVYVEQAPAGRPVTVYGGGSINSIVYLSNGNGSVQDILSPVTISEPPQGGRFTISLLDYNDPVLRHVTFTATGISGLTPMPVTFGESIPTELYVQTGTGGSDVNFLSTPNFFHDETQIATVQGNSANDTVHVGNGGSVQNIHGKLYVENNPNRTTNLYVDDSSDSGNRTVTMRTDPAQFPYGQITGLAPGTIDYEYAHVTAVDVHTGTGTEVVNVAATGPRGLNLIGHSAHTTVTLGSAGSVQGIQGEVTVSNPPSLTDLYVYDDSDSGNRTVAVGDDPADPTYGQIIGLAPGPIYYHYGDVTAVDVHTGTGTETVNLTATGSRGVNLIGHSAHTTVNVGNAGSVQQIRGEVTVSNSAGFGTDLTVDDRNDTGSRTPLLSTDPSDATFGQITGLALGVIYYRYADTASLVVLTGTNTATVNVLATGANVNDLGGNDPQGLTINLGNAGSVQPIRGAMSLSNDAGPLNINFNDQNDTVDRNVTLDDFNSGREFMRLVGLAPTTIFSATTNAGGNYIINGGSGSNLFSVASTSALITTTINGGAGNNHFVLEDPATGTMDNIQGPVRLFGGAGDGLNYVEFYDFSSTTGHTYTVTDFSMTRDGIGPVTFSGLSQINLYRGSGDDLVVCQLTGAGPFLNTGSATNAGGTDTLVGPDGSTNLWQLIDGSQDQLFADGNEVAVFGGFSDLQGGSGTSMFQFSDGYQLSGSITGGAGGMNTLDYSAYTTGVDVNFQTGTATGMTGGLGNIQNVIGGQGSNILVGDGNENLTGGTGPNLLISGGGTTQLTGGGAGDILIGGTTAYDTDDASLQAILTYWTTSGDDYPTRVANLRAGNGVPQLEGGVTVFDNGAANTLTGNGNEAAGVLNLFYATEAGTVADQQPDEVVVDIDNPAAPSAADHTRTKHGLNSTAPWSVRAPSVAQINSSILELINDPSPSTGSAKKASRAVWDD